ncbi:hypothetical protein [Methylomonas sp. MgM2]
MDAARFSQGLGSPCEKPLTKVTARRINAAWGRLSFGYFSLAGQRKVSRLPVRQIGRIADLHAKHPTGETQGCVS